MVFTETFKIQTYRHSAIADCLCICPMTKNQIEYAKYLESKRTNLANEAIQSRLAEHKRDYEWAILGENMRHSLEQESNARDQVSTQRYQADTQRLQASNNERAILETMRSNLVRERETERSNSVNEQLKAISLKQTDRDIDNRIQLTDIQRQNAETNRLSTQNSSYTQLLNYMLDKDRLSETVRSNKEREAIEQSKNVQGWFDTGTSVYANVIRAVTSIISLFK